MLLGPEAMKKLSRAHVVVFGVGGVGSYAVEALARSGVGAITIVDRDEIGLSNLNRQLGALHSTLGRPKAEVMAERVLDINPECRVYPRYEHYSADTRDRFFPADGTILSTPLILSPASSTSSRPPTRLISRLFPQWARETSLIRLALK